MRAKTRTGAAPHDHVVHLYSGDEDMVAAVAGYLGDAIRAGEVAIAVVAPRHADALRATMSAAGIDVAAACDRGDLVVLDAAEALARFTVGDWPDAAAFNREIGAIIEQARERGQRVRVFGEMVALLWDAGFVAAAIELETLWNDLAARLPFSLYCAYASQSVGSADRQPDLARVCRLHSAVVSAAETSRSFTRRPDAPTSARRFVVDLLRVWGRHDVVDDASLVTAELASNAVIHARTGFSVGVSAGFGVVRIAVRDRSLVLPRSRHAPATAISGRGLALVAELGRRWGTELLGDGKVVWVDLGS